MTEPVRILNLPDALIQRQHPTVGLWNLSGSRTRLAP